MALTSGPNLGLLENAALGEAHYAEQTRLLRGLDGLVQPRVISMSLTAPPATPANGDCYIPASGATGAWTGHSNKIARWSSFVSVWEIIPPRVGWHVYDIATSKNYRYNGTAWVDATGELQTQITNHTSNTNNPHSVTAAQAGADPAGTATTAVNNHVALADPHTQYARFADMIADFVLSGLLSPTSSNLTTTLAAGAAYVAGLRVTKAADTFTYAASSDTYDDISSAGVVTHVAVANGVAEPAVTASNLRLQKVVTNATAVTAVTRLASMVVTIPRGLGETVVSKVDAGVGTKTLPLKISRTGAATSSTERQVGIGFEDGNNPTLVGGVVGVRHDATNNFLGSLAFLAHNTSGTAATTLGNLSEVGRWLHTGQLGVGLTAPAASVHIKAGSAAAGTAPLRINSGTRSTNPVPGQMQYDGIWWTTASDEADRMIATTIYTRELTAVTVGASPFLYQNTTGHDIDMLTTGGAVSLIEFSRDGGVFYNVGITTGFVNLSRLDRVRVTYSAVPVMNIVWR